MQHEWMIDVLNDLRAFSCNHKMHRLADQLDDAILVAVSEMAHSDMRTEMGAKCEAKTRGADRSVDAS